MDDASMSIVQQMMMDAAMQSSHKSPEIVRECISERCIWFHQYVDKPLTIVIVGFGVGFLIWFWWSTYQFWKR